MHVLFFVVVAFAVALGSAGARAEAPPAGRTMADVLAAAVPADWRSLDPENTLYVELEAGRVVIELAPRFALPWGGGPLGFYEDPAQHVPIRSVRVAADVPASERARLEVLRTDTATFAALVESRRNRRDDWYRVPAGYIDLCNVPIVVRAR